MLVADAGHGGVVGYTAGEVHDDGEGFIDFVAVDPTTRGAGIGRQLVVAATRRVLDRSPLGRVGLTVQDHRLPARSLYQQLGFRSDGSLIAYRASGLVPAEYSSAGRRRGGQHISREGSVELRSAIIELGRGLAGHVEDFAAYRRRLRSSGKRPAVAAVAVGHRAHRLAFAMLRNQQPYDPNRWAAAVADGPVMAKTGGRPTTTT